MVARGEVLDGLLRLSLSVRHLESGGGVCRVERGSGGAGLLDGGPLSGGRAPDRGQALRLSGR